MMQEGGTGNDRPFFGTRAGAALIVFLLAAGFLLVLEHRAHIPGEYLLLGLILVLCLGMHRFMHGGHGGHGGGHGSHGSAGDSEAANSAQAGDDHTPANDKGAR